MLGVMGLLLCCSASPCAAQSPAPQEVPTAAQAKRGTLYIDFNTLEMMGVVPAEGPEDEPTLYYAPTEGPMEQILYRGGSTESSSPEERAQIQCGFPGSPARTYSLTFYEETGAMTLTHPDIENQNFFRVLGRPQDSLSVADLFREHVHGVYINNSRTSLILVTGSPGKPEVYYAHNRGPLEPQGVLETRPGRLFMMLGLQGSPPQRVMFIPVDEPDKYLIVPMPNGSVAYFMNAAPYGDASLLPDSPQDDPAPYLQSIRQPVKTPR